MIILFVPSLYYFKNAKPWQFCSSRLVLWITLLYNRDVLEQIWRIWVVLHIPKFGDASKSPAGDAVGSHSRCIISFRDAHPPHSHPHLLQKTPHLPREMWSHLQIAGYVTLLAISLESTNIMQIYHRLSILSERNKNKDRKKSVSPFLWFLH
jgi:hypothetical protein